jgi:hypothetical protein
MSAGGVAAAPAYPGARSSAMRTGFPRADARDDFDRALRQARWAQLAERLRGRPASCGRLPVLGQVTIVTSPGDPPATGPAGRPRRASQEAVPIDRIVGSVEAVMCFDRLFRPTSQLPRERFERIAADVLGGRGMDPVELYRCDGSYYVLDGHHRIAVARAHGERTVWATVTEVRLSHPAPPSTAPTS